MLRFGLILSLTAVLVLPASSQDAAKSGQIDRHIEVKLKESGIKPVAIAKDAAEDVEGVDFDL